MGTVEVLTMETVLVRDRSVAAHQIIAFITAALYENAIIIVRLPVSRAVCAEISRN